MEHNNGSLAGDMWREMPAWARVGLQFGAPTLCAGWLVYLFSTALVGDVRELKASVLQHVVSTDNMLARINEQRTNQDAKIDVLIRIAQTQCVNAATDALQRRDCINASK